MPNQPKTRARPFRIPDPIAEALDARAEAEQLTATAVVVEALTEHLTRLGYLTDAVTPPPPQR